ncbi:hypothetical protein H2198_007826 [Neophaeococcomyces mojaviensis]|uniref:Uncharacterized protein n=1 Tax=Neophaeococcomyces mojaviensis TaxID=3383035 RepID=A0ACC2ZZD1_9EURO|nr:hypothetical protein H2198_007826 [Knufia sp. JES_112]
MADAGASFLHDQPPVNAVNLSNDIGSTGAVEPGAAALTSFDNQTTMNSGLHSNSDGREMLDLIDRLRNIKLIRSTITLPQIVVVGQQSSGKSSVLNAISGIHFPVNEGLTTQFPTEIILRREDSRSTKAWFRVSNPLPTAQKLALEALEARWRSDGITLEQLPQVISEAKHALELNGNTRFSSQSLVLEICGPEQEHLTLVDLPGFFASTLQDQSTDDIHLVDGIVQSYMKNERAILLAVFTGANDFENQILLQMLKDNEQYRARTLGVIAAPDCIGAGTAREQICLKLVRNQDLTLQHGWHLLRNLALNEAQQNLDRDTEERNFFETQQPWCHIDKSLVGQQALKTCLSRVLQASIARVLPVLEKEISGRLTNIQDQLNALGSERFSPEQQKDYLCNRGTLFQQALKDTLEGKPQFGELESTEKSLRARIRCLGESFRDTMDVKGRSWTLIRAYETNPDEALRQEYIKDIFAGKYDTTMAVCETDMLSWLSRQIRMHQGLELPNLVDPHWAGQLFQYQSRRWKNLAKDHLNTVFEIVNEYVLKTVKAKFDVEAAGKILQHLVLPSMKQRQSRLEEKLDELCKPYSSRYPQTLSKRLFVASRARKENEANASLLDDAQGFISAAKSRLILDTVDAVYDICSEIFVDNIQNLGVENCLLNDLDTLAAPSKFWGMDEAGLENLAGESPENKAFRAQLKHDQEQFKNASDEILPSLAARQLNRIAPSGMERNPIHAVSTPFSRSDRALDKTSAQDVPRQTNRLENPERSSSRMPHRAAPSLPSDSSTDSASTLHPNHPSSPPKTPRKTSRSAGQRVQSGNAQVKLDMANDVSDTSSPPSTNFSSRSDRATSSSFSSLQASPNVQNEKGGLEFNVPQRTATESSML